MPSTYCKVIVLLIGGVATLAGDRSRRTVNATAELRHPLQRTPGR